MSARVSRAHICEAGWTLRIGLFVVLSRVPVETRVCISLSTCAVHANAAVELRP